MGGLKHNWTRSKEAKSGQIKNSGLGPLQVTHRGFCYQEEPGPHSCSQTLWIWEFGEKKKKKSLRKTECGDDSGSPPWSSICPSLHLDCVYVDVSYPRRSCPSKSHFHGWPLPTCCWCQLQRWESEASRDWSQKTHSPRHRLVKINCTWRCVSIDLKGTEHSVLFFLCGLRSDYCYDKGV